MFAAGIDAASAPGTNFGWRQMEGEHCYDGASCDPTSVTCPGEPDCFDTSLRLPVTEYVNSQQAGGEGCSVTGGYVYRGCRMPSFAGTYFYGDYCTGFVRSLRIAGGAATDPQDWTDTLGVSIANNLTSFGQDAEGEVFLVERTGTVSKIVPPFADIPVSGAGARSFLLSDVADWTWEDLGYTSEYPVQTYKVYRGLPGGTFTCVQQTLVPSWTGDPDVPAPGGLFAYIVTATLPGGEESSSGEPPRTLSPDPCQ